MVGQPPMSESSRLVLRARPRSSHSPSCSLFLSSLGQQSYVTRYDIYGGYAFLNSPNVSLFEHGFASQIGFRPKTWVSVGFDYTIAAGDLRLRPRPVASRSCRPSSSMGLRRESPPGYSLPITRIATLERPGAFPDADLRGRPAARLPALLQSDTVLPSGLSRALSMRPRLRNRRIRSSRPSSVV